MKFTFKRHPKITGLAGVVDRESTDIKLNKQKVGIIDPPNWRSSERGWSVRVTVKNPDNSTSNCKWRWVTFKARFDTEDAARGWVKEYLEVALKKNLLELYPLTD